MNPVIGSLLGVAKRPVGAGHRHRREPRGVEMRAGPWIKVLVDVDRRHCAALPHDVGYQRGVVARGCSDLQHPLAPLQTQLLEHDRHDRRLRRRAHRQPVRSPLGDERLVAR
jgi:hypothetical protein